MCIRDSNIFLQFFIFQTFVCRVLVYNQDVYKRQLIRRILFSPVVIISACSPSSARFKTSRIKTLPISCDSSFVSYKTEYDLFVTTPLDVYKRQASRCGTDKCLLRNFSVYSRYPVIDYIQANSYDYLFYSINFYGNRCLAFFK